MTLALNLIASNGSELEWSRALMIAWLTIALTLSVIEIWLIGGFRNGFRQDLQDGTGLSYTSNNASIQRYE
jgi:hypothetical protein